MGRLPHNLRQFRRLIATPLTSCVLLAGLVLIAMNIGTGQWERSVLGSVVREYLLRVPDSPGTAHPPRFFLQRDPSTGESRIISEEFESWDELSKLMVERPDDMAEIHIFADVQRTGLWALTRHHDAWRPLWVWMGEPWPQEHQRRGLRAVADHLVVTRGQRWASLADGAEAPAQVLLGGYLLNVLSAVLLIGLVLSLAWLVRVPAWLSAGRRRLQRRPWMCKACGYDMRGLDMNLCPECGAGQTLASDAGADQT